MDVELHVRDRPARGQIFQGRGRGGFNALRGENRKDQARWRGPSKNTRLNDAAISSSGLVSDAFGEIASEKNTGFPKERRFRWLMSLRPHEGFLSKQLKRFGS